MKNASENGLRISQDASLKWAERCGVAIVLGLVIEIVAWLVLEGWSWRVFWTAFLPDVLIALGVGGELLFSAHAKAASDELGRRAAENIAKANERAEKLELERVELERKLSPRNFSMGQRTMLADRMRQWATLPDGMQQFVRLFCTTITGESTRFMSQISSALREAGWSVDTTPEPHGTPSSWWAFGIAIQSSGDPRSLMLGMELMRVLRELGFRAECVAPEKGSVLRIMVGDNLPAEFQKGESL